MPSKNQDENAVLRTARMACTEAAERGLQFINPHLHFTPVLPPDAMQGRPFWQKTQWWLRRAGQIWVAFVDERETALDDVSYRILMGNEMVGSVHKAWNAKGRARVYRLRRRDDNDIVSIDAFTRDELTELLQCNIIDGLLQGGLL